MLLLLPLAAPSMLDLAKILGVPVALFLMARYLTRRDKRRDEAATEETRALKANKETADAERAALRAESDKNKADHERFHKFLDEMNGITQRLQADVQSLKMDMTRSDMRGEATKETMARIDGPLGRLIDTYRTIS